MTGEHDKILKAFESTNKFLENTNIEEIIKKGNKKQNVREIHRVSYLVAKITEESFVVPKCAFQLDHNDCLSLNLNFINNIRLYSSLNNYALFKKPEKRHLMVFTALRNKPDAIELFLNIEEKDPWFKTENTFNNNEKIIRSNLWPGSLSYFINGTNEFGNLYMGNGLKRRDLHFLSTS